MASPASTPRPLRVVYATYLQQSVHEYNILRHLAHDPRFSVVLTTCEPQACHPGIVGLPLTFRPSPEAPWQSSIRGLRRGLFEFRHWCFVAHLRRLLAEFDADLLYASWLTRSGYAAQQTGFHPVLVRTWGSDVLNNPHVANPHNSPFLRRRAIAAARHADAIFSDAAAVADTLTAFAGIARDKFAIIPNPSVDTAAFGTDPARRHATRQQLGYTDQPVYFCHRDLSPVYGHADLLRAWPAVRQAYPQARLLLLGNGPLRGELEQLVATLGIGQQVRFLEPRWYTDDELKDLLRAADVYVSTSLSDGTSLSLLEAMSSALPVVVTDVPAILSWVQEGDGGFIAKRSDPASISAALCRALAARAAWPAMGTRNRATAAARGDARVCYEQLAALMLRVVAAHPHAPR